MAMEKALYIARQTKVKIIMQNIYEVPSGYHTTGKDFAEFSTIMKGHAQKDYEQFMQEIDLEGIDKQLIDSRFELDEYNDTGQMVYNLAVNEQADLIIIGSKGRTALASILLGSVAEKLVAYTDNIPLLIVKNKNETLSFLEAIFKL